MPFRRCSLKQIYEEFTKKYFSLYTAIECGVYQFDEKWCKETYHSEHPNNQCVFYDICKEI